MTDKNDVHAQAVKGFAKVVEAAANLAAELDLRTRRKQRMRAFAVYTAAALLGTAGVVGLIDALTTITGCAK